ncbi:MAG: TolC family protein [Verrucomicrobiota bacterium]|nr:TolC family protein [Verrucomicrobiota bacterium]
MKRLSFILALGACCVGRFAEAITLDAALARTLEHNPAIQAERLALEQASGRRLVLRSLMWPDVRLNAVAGDQGGKRAGEDSNQPFGFARGFFTQPLFNAAIPASNRRGDIEVLLAQQRLVAATVTQLHAARLAFYTTLYNRSLVTLAEGQRQRLAANVATETEKYRAGHGGRDPIAAARVVEGELNPRIETARRAQDGAILTLAQLMGDELGSNAALPNPEGELRMTPGDLDFETNAAIALSRRADVQVARLLVRAAGEDERIVQAGYYPLIAATISGDYIPISGIRRGSEGSPRRSDDIISSEVRFGAAYTWRVIDNGKVGGQVAQRRAIREMNKLLLQKVEADAAREIAVAEARLRAVGSSEQALGRAGAAAEKNVGLVQQNLAQGLTSQLEFRNAETAFLQAQTARLSLAYEQNVARAEYDRASGRYFQFSGDTTHKPD